MSTLFYKLLSAHKELQPQISRALGMELVDRITPMTPAQAHTPDQFGIPRIRYTWPPSEEKGRLLVNPYVASDTQEAIFLRCCHELLHDAYARQAPHIYLNLHEFKETEEGEEREQNPLFHLAMIHNEGFAEYASLHAFSCLYAHEHDQMERHRAALLRKDVLYTENGPEVKATPHAWGYSYFLDTYGEDATFSDVRRILEGFFTTPVEVICASVDAYLEDKRKSYEKKHLDDVLFSLDRE